jgi:hypothetical protein
MLIPPIAVRQPGVRGNSTGAFVDAPIALSEADRKAR